MKKIGILTFHRANNFGAVLQNFALQKAIISLGYDVETIDYRIPRIENQYKLFSSILCRNPVNLVKKKYWEVINFRNALKSENRFDDFREKCLRISTNKYFRQNISTAQYDTFVVGSDQIWSTDIIDPADAEVFSLSFTDKNKASYAASCGNVTSMIDCIEQIRLFDIVTVRECELCTFLSEKDIPSTVVCDPTLLLDKNEWIKCISGVEKEYSNYVYLYYIESGRNDAAKIAHYLAKEQNSTVLFPKKLDKEAKLNKYGVSCFSDGPLEFVEKITDANYVVAASFHGVALSVVLEKEFVAVLHHKTGSRVRTLLEKLGLEDRIVESYDEFIKKSDNWKPIDYSKVKIILDKWRDESIAELIKICEL